MSECIIYCDGSSGRDRSGGWAAVIATPASLVELAGWAADTTNNRMEMTGALMGLRELTGPHKVMLVSDSAYLLNTLRSKWYVDWFKHEDRRLAGDAAYTFERPNLDLWRELVKGVEKHEVEYVKVKGHTGEEWNERADYLASLARTSQLSLRHESPDFQVWV